MATPQDFGWPSPAPMAPPAPRPMAPGFNLADSLERIRAARAQAESVPGGGIDLAQVVSDSEDKRDWDRGMEAMRQFRGMKANGVRGPWDEAAQDPMTMGRNSQVAREGGVPHILDKDYDPWRDPGALTVPQTQAKYAEDLRRKAEDAESADYSQWQKGYDRDRADEARVRSTQKDIEALSAGIPMDAPADPVVPGYAADAGENADDTAAAMKSLEPGRMAPEDRKPVAPSRGFAGNDRAKQAADIRAGNRYSEPSEAPLPGEETLPPGVAAWNHDRAQSGMGGLDELRRAYDIEQANEPNDLSFADWLESKGLKGDTHPVKAGEILDRVLSENLAKYPDHYKERGEGDQRISADDDSVLSDRRGLADDTATHKMTPEQKRRVGTHYDGIPRTERGGREVWDQGARDGEGAYVPRGYDKAMADQAMREGNIRKEAMAYGIDHRAYGDNEAQLRADVGARRKRLAQLGKSYDVTPVEGGGTRLTANSQTQERMRKIKEDQFVSTMTKRFAQEFAQRGVDPSQVASEIRRTYREGLAANSKLDPADRHRAAAGFTNENLLDSIRGQRDATLQLAVNKRADQFNRAQAFGMPVHMVRALDTLGSARTPQEQVNALSVLHAAAPAMGFDRMAAMLLRGQVESQQLAQWAQMNGGKPKGMDALEGDLQDVQGGPVGPDTVIRAQAIASRAAGQNATAEQIRQQRNMILQPKAREIAAQGNASPQEITMLSQVVQGMSPAEFYQYLGLDPNDRKSWAKYEQVTGRSARNVFQKGYDNAVGAAGIIGRVGSQAISAIQSAQPTAFAGTGSDSPEL